MSAVTIDTSDLDGLRRLLSTAGDMAPVEAHKVLGDVVDEVYRAAHANASSFTRDSTGELAAALDRDTSGMSRRVFANVRQAHFLEYGSPNTGAPRAWLSAPAEAGSRRLLEAMGDVGRIW